MNKDNTSLPGILSALAIGESHTLPHCTVVRRIEHGYKMRRAHHAKRECFIGSIGLSAANNASSYDKRDGAAS